MKLVKGITKEYRFELRDENGKTILNPEDIKIIIRKRPRTNPVLEKTLSGGDITWSDNEKSWYFSISEADLSPIDLGHYGFVCVLTTDGNEKTIYKSEANVVNMYTAPADDEYYPNKNDQFAIYQAMVQGGSGGDSKGEWVGNVDETKTALPTERPDGEPLENWDFVTVDRNATLPFTIEGLEFQNPKDRAVYLGGVWKLNTSAYQNTDETPVADKVKESMSGTATTQSSINKEVVIKNRTLSVERLGAYIYQATFDKVPDYEPLATTTTGGCSSFVQDGKLYRNLDWNYDNTAEFHIITKDFEGMAFIPELEDENLDYEKIAQLPYHVNDGVNRDGIMVSSHILYNDWGYTGTGSKNKEIALFPHYILTNLHSMTDISAVLSDYLSNIKINASLAAKEYLMQFVVSDGTTTYAILPPESASGAYVLQDITTNPKLTNFRWVSNATVVRADLQNRPNGVERWNEISDGAKLADLRFTKAYENPTRLSDFIGEAGTTKSSTDAELEAIYDAAHAQYLTRTRDGSLWQTVHAVVYGNNGMEHLFAQENFEKDYIVSAPEIEIETIDTIIDDATKIPSAKAIYQYIASGNNGNARSVTGVDISNILDTGLYACTSCWNTPNNKDGQMLVIRYPGHAVQLYSVDADAELYIRFAKGAFGRWKKVFIEDKITSKDITLDDSSVESTTGQTKQNLLNKEFNDRIKFIESKADVADIVQCYDRGTDETKTDIVHYDLSAIFVNDIVKVLIDETHDNLTSYYKLIESGDPLTKSFTYIGSDRAVGVDDVTIEKNSSNQLKLKVGGVVYPFLNSNLVSQLIPPEVSAQITKITSEKAVATALKDKQDDILTNISGTAGQVLKRNSANNGLEFGAISSNDFGYLSGEQTRDNLLSLLSNDKSGTCWCRFSSSEGPTVDNTDNFNVFIQKGQTAHTITAVSQTTGRIFTTSKNGSTWSVWNAAPAMESGARTALTRDIVANTLLYNGKHSFFGKFTAAESPNGNTWTFEIEVSMAKDAGHKYYEIKVNHPDSTSFWVSRAHGSGTSFTWSAWAETAYKKEVVTSISSSSTDKQVPSAKAVYEATSSSGALYYHTATIAYGSTNYARIAVLSTNPNKMTIAEWGVLMYTYRSSNANTLFPASPIVPYANNQAYVASSSGGSATTRVQPIAPTYVTCLYGTGTGSSARLYCVVTNNINNEITATVRTTGAWSIVEDQPTIIS